MKAVHSEHAQLPAIGERVDKNCLSFLGFRAYVPRHELCRTKNEDGPDTPHGQKAVVDQSAFAE